MYPCWRYHATEEPRIIHSSAEEAIGWTASPADHGRVPFVSQTLTGGPMQLSAAPPAAAPVAADAPGAAPTRARAAKKPAKARGK